MVFVEKIRIKGVKIFISG